MISVLTHILHKTLKQLSAGLLLLSRALREPKSLSSAHPGHIQAPKMSIANFTILTGHFWLKLHVSTLHDLVFDIDIA